MDLLLWQTIHNLAIQEAGKLHVETLVARNELVTGGQAREEATLLHPEDSAEGTTEEDALDRGKADEARGEVGILRVNPTESPLGLLLNAGDRLCGVEDLVLLLLVRHVVVNEKRIRL